MLRWLKSVGDTVAEHEPLIELETDKVTVEIAAPAAGVLREIVKAEQEEIAPGEVLGRMELAVAGVGSIPGAGSDFRSEPSDVLATATCHRSRHQRFLGRTEHPASAPQFVACSLNASWTRLRSQVAAKAARSLLTTC